MKQRILGCALTTLVVATAGCSSMGSMVDKVNPFSGSARKIPELPALASTSAELRTGWQTSVGASGEYVFTPAVVERSVYSAARDGSLTRIDDGQTVWRINVDQVISGGVGSDGKLVAVGTPKGDVLVFDAANGNALWKANIKSEVLAAPTIGDGMVIVRGGDSRIFGLEAANGKRRWIYQRPTPPLLLRSHVGVTLASHTVVAGFPGGKLVAIGTTNGAALWEATVAVPRGATELERVADITSIPVAQGRDVCAVAYQGRVACFEMSSGTLIWARDISSSAGLDMDNKYVYVTDDKGVVQAFDRSNGASIWKQDKLQQRGLTRPVAIGSFIAVADSQGVAHLLWRDDGGLAARYSGDSSAVVADLQRVSNGFVMQNLNGGIYSLTVK